MDLFICLNVKITEKGGKRQKPLSIDYFPDGHVIWGVARLPSSVQVFCVGSRDPIAWAASCALPGTQQENGLKAEQPALDLALWYGFYFLLVMINKWVL